MPDDVALTKSCWLNQLGEDAVVTVIAERTLHGLVGAPSNHSNFNGRRAFIEFVEGCRTPTGRTLQTDGRYHGAQYYLNCQFTCIRAGDNKSQNSRMRDQVERARAVVDGDGAASSRAGSLQVLAKNSLADTFQAAMRTG